jgi:hypothetical protein
VLIGCSSVALPLAMPRYSQYPQACLRNITATIPQ